VEIRIFKQSDPDYLLSLILRYKILRIPLGLTFSSADLAKDRDDIHIGAFDEDVLLASLILTDVGDGTIKMRQVAVDDIYQGKGLGKSLVKYADDYARDKGYKLIHCHARDTAKAFYLKQGYKVVGDEFTEVGIRHYYMEKALITAQN
jgi:GNAT superfamily N-acetyltransferase